MIVRVQAETDGGKKYAQFFGVSQELLDNELDTFLLDATFIIERDHAQEPVKVTEVKIIEEFGTHVIFS